MKRTPLQRHTPLRPRKALASSGPLRRQSKPSPRPRVRQGEPRDFEHMGRVKALPCALCQRLGLRQETPTEAHHIKRDPATGRVLGTGQKAPDHHTIPLCVRHHREGARGEAFHRGRGPWEAAHGSELAILDETLHALGGKTTSAS